MQGEWNSLFHEMISIAKKNIIEIVYLCYLILLKLYICVIKCA